VLRPANKYMAPVKAVSNEWVAGARMALTILIGSLTNLGLAALSH
jgi:hypothetical protein